MKALVISGGGAKGAFAGGVAEYLIREQRQQYDILVGASTGSLLIPLLALEELERLKKTYTSIKQSDIFSNCPFKIVTKGWKKEVNINYWNVAKMFFWGRKTFGDSSQLRKTIAKVFTKAHFDRLKASQKEVILTVANLSLQKVEYKSIKEYNYDEFCDWMWISANLVPFMSLVQKNGMDYGDGGIGNNVPIQVAINKGATEIDVIVLSPAKQAVNHLGARHVFDLIFDIFGFMLRHMTLNRMDNVVERLMYAKEKITICCYHTPYILTENPLIFDAQQMTRWWIEGYETARQQSQCSNLIQTYPVGK